ncbi:hypothetical protein [Micromonospora sp. NPDC005324]|uniref:hypothetical protein n=1 Tax=Micromonospora sp. NPDC005324 TaxID=3157033 RepID=UPI0033A52EC1
MSSLISAISTHPLLTRRGLAALAAIVAFVATNPAALVAQDGLKAPAVPWHAIDALFIGGSTAWKLRP